jgi:hypothetical protein
LLGNPNGVPLGQAIGISALPASLPGDKTLSWHMALPGGTPSERRLIRPGLRGWGQYCPRRGLLISDWMCSGKSGEYPHLLCSLISPSSSRPKRGNPAGHCPRGRACPFPLRPFIGDDEWRGVGCGVAKPGFCCPSRRLRRSGDYEARGDGGVVVVRDSAESYSAPAGQTV